MIRYKTRKYSRYNIMAFVKNNMLLITDEWCYIFSKFFFQNVDIHIILHVCRLNFIGAFVEIM